MIVVSMANKKYKERLLFSMAQSKKFGYEHVAYDLGHLGFGKKYELKGKITKLSSLNTKQHICLSKPALMLDALNSTEEDVVYLDSDAFLVSNIDEVQTDDYDVGVTYRGGHAHSYINAGVLFLKNNDNARRFLELWLERIDNVEETMKKEAEFKRGLKSIGDNILLNELVWHHVPHGGWNKNRVKDVDGVRVKFFDYTIYNNFRVANIKSGKYEVLPEKVKVVHMYLRTQKMFNRALKLWEL